MWQFIRRCLIGGLLIWLPIWATLFVLGFVVHLLDSTVSLLPHDYQPEQFLGFQIPGLGVVLAILVLFFTGLLVSNFMGRRLLSWWEFILARIPLVRSIYSAVKQVSQTVLVPNGQAFRQVLLVQFPHQNSWTIAFLVGQSLPEVNKVLNQAMITVYVPTTPNPTSGYIIMVPKEQTKVLEMSIDEALKFVISLGVVQPGVKKNSIVLGEDNA
jgi:uncharacterized membrane protein